VHSRMIVFCLMGVLLIASACSDDCPTISRPEPGWHSLGLEDMTIQSLALDYPYLYACAGGNGLYRGNVTKEDGEWEYLGLVSSTYPNIHGGTVHDALVLHDNTILAAACYYAKEDASYPPSLHRSEDNGDTWIASDTGIVQDNGDFCCPGPLSSCDHFTFAGTYGCGIFRSDDSGLHWDKSGAQLGWFYGPDCLEQSPVDCSIIWQAGIDGTEQSRIAVSDDHGASWKWIVPSTSIRYVGGVIPDPVNANTAYIGTYGSLMKTDDLGSSVETVLEMSDNAWTNTLAPGRAAGHIFVAVTLFSSTDTNVIYEIQDGVGIVDTLTVPVTGLVSDMIRDNERETLYVGGQEGVYRYVY
jgi:hypothetical protein